MKPLIKIFKKYPFTSCVMGYFITCIVVMAAMVMGSNAAENALHGLFLFLLVPYIVLSIPLMPLFENIDTKFGTSLAGKDLWGIPFPADEAFVVIATFYIGIVFLIEWGFKRLKVKLNARRR